MFIKNVTFIDTFLIHENQELGQETLFWDVIYSERFTPLREHTSRLEMGKPLQSLNHS